jgi:hypothetical protein
MKQLFVLLILATSALTFSAHAADKCDRYKQEIGTKVQVSLALENGQAQTRQFEVTSCKGGIFTALDKTQNSTIMQYNAGQGDTRQIRFVGTTQNSSQFHPVISGRWNIKTQQVTFATPGPGQCQANEHWDAGMKMCMPNQCPVGQHWDSAMNMCMPDTAQQCPQGEHWDPGMKMCMPDENTTCPTGYHWDASVEQCMPDEVHQCPAGQHWDEAMKMCMPDGNSKDVMTMFHYNQFVVLTGGSGPRGRTAVTAPNMWMLMFDKKTSARNTLELSWMGTTDLWTIPKNGTPELFQAGEANAAGTPFIDAQHPHSSPIMGLTLSDILSFGANGENKLTFFFAPRGEATAGPEGFMHRASAEGNPDAPLGHHLQDVFHISSTVVGMKVDYGKWTVEASTFSGVEPSPSVVNLDMHKPDSYAFRTNYRVNDNVTVGGSYARVRALDRANNPTREIEDERAYAAWVQTSNMLKGGKFSTTTLWGQNDNRTSGEQLNSFLEEFLFELGKNNFYGRFEVVQRTPEQLEVQVTDGKTGAKWIKAYTLGYERQLRSRGPMKLYAGAAVTTYSVPRDFRVSYGSNPVAAKVYLRLKFNTGMHH